MNWPSAFSLSVEAVSWITAAQVADHTATHSNGTELKTSRTYWRERPLSYGGLLFALGITDKM
jgi:hypothetical protein